MSCVKKFALIAIWMILCIGITSCSKKKIRIAENAFLVEKDANTKLVTGNTCYPESGGILGFMLKDNYFYGWHNQKKDAVTCFFYDLNTDSCEEGDFDELKNKLSKKNISMPSMHMMHNELTYPLFLEKTESELSAIMESRGLELRKISGGYSIFSKRKR